MAVLDKLAHLGRYGDSEIRNIDNKPSHVNINEAMAIDSLNKIGESRVKEKGAGTINPYTNMPEYFDLDDLSDPEWWFGENSIWADYAPDDRLIYPSSDEDVDPWDRDSAYSGADRYIGSTDRLQDMYQSGEIYDYLSDVWDIDSRNKIDTFMNPNFGDLSKFEEYGNIDAKRDAAIGKAETEKGLAAQALESNLKSSRRDLLFGFDEDMLKVSDAQSSGLISDSMNRDKKRLLKKASYSFENRRDAAKAAKIRADMDYDYAKKTANLRHKRETLKQDDAVIEQFYEQLANLR